MNIGCSFPTCKEFVPILDVRTKIWNKRRFGSRDVSEQAKWDKQRGTSNESTSAVSEQAQFRNKECFGTSEAEQATWYKQRGTSNESTSAVSEQAQFRNKRSIGTSVVVPVYHRKNFM